MKIEKIDHICFAVKDLEDTKRIYKDDFGLLPDCEYIADSEKIKVARYYIGEVAVEFMESTSPDGGVAKFIEKKGEGVHHIAFAVNELEKQLDDARAQGIRLVNEKSEKGAEGLDIAFIHPRSASGVLIELCEDKSI